MDLEIEVIHKFVLNHGITMFAERHTHVPCILVFPYPTIRIYALRDAYYVRHQYSTYTRRGP